MAEKWFRVPVVEIDGPEDFRGDAPKYHEEVNGYNSTRISEDEYLVKFQGDPDVLQSILEKPDTESVDYITAQIIQYENESNQENDFSPIPDPQGDTPSDRLEDFIEKLNEGLTLGGDGVKIAQPVIFTGSNILFDQPIHFSTIGDLRTYPRYLFDLILRSKTSTVSTDFLSYWNFTKDFLSFSLGESDVFDRLTNPDTAGQPDNFAFAGIVHDFRSLIDYVLVEQRIQGVDRPTQQFVKNITGLGATSPESAFRIAGPTSLAILDGLVKRRCPNLDQEGNVNSGQIEATWRPGSPDRSGLTYHDRLQHWKEHVATDTTNDSLSIINDLNRYSLSELQLLAGVMGNTSILDRERDSTQNFLAVMSEQRNFNIHGNGSGAIIGVLGLTLCCLVIWDMIDEQDYYVLREDWLKNMEN
ncbi:hypothetical protein Halru_2510 [Halovivax ruber XH-70]|uniref:Uncharacterized protein n=1 Tax=Halovivax ruber (strain DSM 18193 / JCM 13892 / XH-70) TaxID=797302 RepID=L0IGH6_HALRX|nr:hypothetical protein [Halovivax ruber]AGB17092.1 hypothetical protein Halru_2510 [Halovivax ruber XH-70]